MRNRHGTPFTILTLKLSHTVFLFLRKIWMKKKEERRRTFLEFVHIRVKRAILFILVIIDFGSMAAGKVAHSSGYWEGNYMKWKERFCEDFLSVGGCAKFAYCKLIFLWLWICKMPTNSDKFGYVISNNDDIQLIKRSKIGKMELSV